MVSNQPCGQGEMFGESTFISATWVFPGQRRWSQGRGFGLGPVGRPGSVHLECPGTRAYAGCHTPARPWSLSSAFTHLRRKRHSPGDQAHLSQEKAESVCKLEWIQDHQMSLLMLTPSHVEQTTRTLWTEKSRSLNMEATRDIGLYRLHSYYKVLCKSVDLLTACHSHVCYLAFT